MTSACKTRWLRISDPICYSLPTGVPSLLFRDSLLLWSVDHLKTKRPSEAVQNALLDQKWLHVKCMTLWWYHESALVYLHISSAENITATSREWPNLSPIENREVKSKWKTSLYLNWIGGAVVNNPLKHCNDTHNTHVMTELTTSLCLD